MKRPTLHQVGMLLKKRRGERGVREVAAEIGVSAATLSRVERGKLPDLDTFSKLCKWLNVDPAEVLGIPRDQSTQQPTTSPVLIQGHFRAERHLSPKAASALAEMILATQHLLLERSEE